MKSLLAIVCISGFLWSCNIRNSRYKHELKASAVNHHFTDSTSVQMIDSVYDFGKVVDGEKVTFSYRFRNTGKRPLVIFSAMASCGCTVPEKPEEPIQPGETGSIKIVFNSQGRVGPTHKQVTVVSNAHPGFPDLQLTGEVIAKK